jgi:multidrug resistance efflux pump
LLQAEATKLQAEADLARDKANLGAEGDANARLRTAKARVHSAHLNLEFTEVRAPVDGYVTNLDLRLGDHATANKPALARVDVDSYWVYGFFKEHYVRNMRVGDRAIVTLMSYPDTPLEGRVVGKGWGVYQDDGATAQQLLPKISPTYEWVRLPQRVPVRVEFDTLPEGVELVVGTTASVLVMTGTAGTESQATVSPTPEALQ